MQGIFDGGVKTLSANKCAVKTTYLFADKKILRLQKNSAVITQLFKKLRNYHSKIIKERNAKKIKICL